MTVAAKIRLAVFAVLIAMLFGCLVVQFVNATRVHPDPDVGTVTGLIVIACGAIAMTMRRMRLDSERRD